MRMHVAVKLRFVGRRIFSFFYFIRNFFISILLDSVRQRREEGEESYKLSRPLTIIRKKMIPVK